MTNCDNRPALGLLEELFWRALDFGDLEAADEYRRRLLAEHAKAKTR